MPTIRDEPDQEPPAGAVDVVEAAHRDGQRGKKRSERERGPERPIDLDDRGEQNPIQWPMGDTMNFIEAIAAGFKNYGRLKIALKKIKLIDRDMPLGNLTFLI